MNKEAKTVRAVHAQHKGKLTVRQVPPHIMNSHLRPNRRFECECLGYFMVSRSTLVCSVIAEQHG